MNAYNKVLVLAPHTDDGELGAGGTIARLVDQGAEVHYCAFSIAEESVPKHLPADTLLAEVKVATAALGIAAQNLHVLRYKVRKFEYRRQEILEDLVQLRRTLQPDLVLTPCLSDVHQDHATIAQETVRAFKQTTVLGYELVWNTVNFSAQTIVPLRKEHIARKVKALAAYTSQEGRAYMSEDFIYGLARVRGVQVGQEFAEAFECVRSVWQEAMEV